MVRNVAATSMLSLRLRYLIGSASVSTKRLMVISGITPLEVVSGADLGKMSKLLTLSLTCIRLSRGRLMSTS